MGTQPNFGKMEGWLYTIQSSRFGLKFSSKRYFILEENHLKCYKTIPISQNEDPVRSAMLDSCIRITDNGRESINRKVLFIFTLYSTLNHNDQLKLGASSSEDAARWIHSLQNAVLKECTNPGKDFVAISKRKWPPIRLSGSKGVDSLDYYSTLHTEAMTSDVIASSGWKIIGCKNGLRLFKEATDWDSYGRHWDDHPAIMAVGVVDGTPETIFHTLMSLGPLRSEWDFCFDCGSVVELLDCHTDIIHKKLSNHWLPRMMNSRDLLLRRYWRREDDGTYVILYHSVIHKKCPPQKGYVRACLKSGGYVISPINQGTRSLVKHMLAVDWKTWKSYVHPSSERSITIRMLERVAALREFFQAKEGNNSAFLSGDLSGQTVLPHIEREDIKVEVKGLEKTKDLCLMENEAKKLDKSLTPLSSLSDEFFEVPDANDMMDFDMENEWSSQMKPEVQTAVLSPGLSSATGTAKKKLHDLAVQKNGYVDLQNSAKEDSRFCFYGTTFRNDPCCSLPCSWAAADPSTYLIRGKNYFNDGVKVNAKGTLMEIVGADWLRSDQRVSDLSSHPDSIVQKYAAQDRPEFFLVINIQFRSSTVYTLALYYMLKTPLEETPFLLNFVNGDDAYRNARFKMIPYIAKGAWIVKQSVRKRGCLVGKALDVNYYRGKNYLEVEIDVASSIVARGLTNLVVGYMMNLVVEMAFLIQSETEEELPECLLGTCRLNYLDAAKAVPL
ncbi:protein ENHANCED DISEASE RESISTANCE 2 isoform X2 [Manihot esculenta]|uniref:START domain-containing protein n=1 Tax=Manihot esculenta TaxID=3983 RepID=A0A2C9VLH8_MANES|nr:protein ENHANCED DISEASE RESISTANCE 2 isoform X2 [Manihot esculenta]OAY45877.1 hypothetical protein MANES_07G099200v8 [Manihot esculenta]